MHTKHYDCSMYYKNNHYFVVHIMWVTIRSHNLDVKFQARPVAPHPIHVSSKEMPARGWLSQAPALTPLCTRHGREPVLADAQ